MSVGLLLITHSAIGQAFLEAGTTVVGSCPMPVEVLEIGLEAEPDQLEQKAQTLLDKLDQGQGVLVLTDLFGSTPSNVAARLYSEKARVIAGLNLAMLIRIFNYPNDELDRLAEKALEAGHAGVINIVTSA